MTWCMPRSGIRGTGGGGGGFGAKSRNGGRGERGDMRRREADAWRMKAGVQCVCV